MEFVRVKENYTFKMEGHIMESTVIIRDMDLVHSSWRTEINM